MADTTTGHSEAVKAVAGQSAPEPPQEQDDAIVVTRDLASEQKIDKKLDDETTKALNDGGENPFTATLTGKERRQVAVRTLPGGKTEAIVEEAPALPVFPPDDGGYNPEKRTHAGPAGTKVPSAVGKNDTGKVDGVVLPPGWKAENLVKNKD